MFPTQVAMIFADTKARTDRKVWQAIIVADCSHEPFERCRVIHSLTKEEVDDRATSIFGLQFVLEIKQLKEIVGVIDRQVCAVGVKRC